MAKDHGSSIKNDKQYEGLREKGMSKQRAAAISNANAGSDNAASKKGGKNSGSGYDLMSMGPDGRANTEDDIVNWSKNK